MYTLIINGKLDGLNNYTKACRTNPYVGAQMKKKNEEIVTAHILSQLQGVRIAGRVRLAFRWYEPNKRRDLDNIAMSKKFILDALVKTNTIKTDSWRGVVGFTDSFFVDAENPRIEVDITEV